MSQGGDRTDMIGINWGSSNFRAYRIGAEGRLVDEFAAPMGVASLDRDGMARAIADLVARWPDAGTIIASGMVGSNIGWIDVPYVSAPAGRNDLAGQLVEAAIGPARVWIVPGITCSRGFDDAPDVLRGEEIELLGLIAMGSATGMAALPGTHTKWVVLEDGRIGDFITAMSGEIFDRLTAQGLLASIVEGEAEDGLAFRDGVATGLARRLGLGTLLFGARARVLRGDLARRDAASYLRGLLIGAEIADALAANPDLAQTSVPLIGNGPLCRLYAAALEAGGISSRQIDSRDACIRGFHALATLPAPVA